MNYSVSDYGSMFDDKWRMDAYITAIKKNINKDTVVLDLGAGTGIFSLLACKFGAKKVFAVEPNTAIKIGIQSARRNGFAERIEFLNKSSSDIQLNEKVDLIISDLRGILPLFGKNIETLIDARKRFLKKNGILIPVSDKIYAAVVHSPRLYKNIVNTWDINRYKLDLVDAKNFCLNSFLREDFKSSMLISDKKLWQLIDYTNIKETNFRKRLNFKMLEKGTAHGISLWFDSNLVPGVKLRNSPEVEGAKVYGRAFFPFFETLTLDHGDRIIVDLSANLVSNDYIWSWNTKIYKKFSKKPIREFKQSTFLSNPLTPEYFIKRTPNYKTSLSEDAEINLEVLNMFSKNKKIIDIAKSIRKKYPKKFKNLKQAVAVIGDLSFKYSK
ncbi:MAG: 50S ribosomal protein L11 methyltransferase [Thermodesulfobacteriota bacterium]